MAINSDKSRAIYYQSLCAMHYRMLNAARDNGDNSIANRNGIRRHMQSIAVYSKQARAHLFNLIDNEGDK